MEEIEKYELINSCEDFNQLLDAFDKIGEFKSVSNISWNYEKLKRNLLMMVMIDDETPRFSLMPRKYGIRQQVMYISYYMTLEKIREHIRQN